MERHIYHYDVGLLFWREMREYLNRQRFMGRNIEWFEGSGWLERRFTVKGSAEDMKYLDRRLRAYFEFTD